MKPATILASLQGDALDPQQPWKDLMKGSMGVVSTLGTFGNNDLMYKASAWLCRSGNMRTHTEAYLGRYNVKGVHSTIVTEVLPH